MRKLARQHVCVPRWRHRGPGRHGSIGPGRLDRTVQARTRWRQFKIDELFASDAVLLGRVTYDAFAPVWPDVKDEAGFGDRMNALPKYVPSRTLDTADWNNTTIWRGDLATEVAKLKAGEGGDIIVYGGAALVHTLAEHDLVDEFRLMIYPVVLGRGKKLFGDGTKIALSLEESKVLGSGIVLMRYTRVPAAS